MTDDLSEQLDPAARAFGLRPPRRPLTALARRRHLNRQDRLSARLASLHHSVGVLTDAEFLADVSWARTASCSACATAGPHGGATGAGTCLVGSIVVAAGGPGQAVAVRDAVALAWRSLYRTGHASGWGDPAVQQLFQVHQLRQWNDDPARTRGQVVSALRATRRAASDALGRARWDALKHAAVAPSFAW